MKNRLWTILLLLAAVLLPVAAARWNPESLFPVSRSPPDTGTVLQAPLLTEFRETPLPHQADPRFIEPGLVEPKFIAQLFYLPRQSPQAPDPFAPPSAGFQTETSAGAVGSGSPQNTADIPGSAEQKPWETAPENFKLLGRIRDTEGTEYVYFKNRESGEIIKTENRQD
ncbi:hypothetical protein FACS1894130_08820 [Spirochaetia bacterium]|nr:hypothetical protein FACS1894130_08820 [Spirochaetia bacterium]